MDTNTDTNTDTDNNTENYPPYFFPAAPSGARDFRRGLTPRQRLFRNRLVARRTRRLSTAQIWALVARRLLALALQVIFFAAALAALLLLALA